MADPSNATTAPKATHDPKVTADPPSSKLADRLDMARVRDIVEILTLWRLYENPRLRHRFRDEAERAGFDVGTASMQGSAQMHEVGELESLFQDVPPPDSAPGSLP